jgi:hypothetical protein
VLIVRPSSFARGYPPFDARKPRSESPFPWSETHRPDDELPLSKDEAVIPLERLETRDIDSVIHSSIAPVGLQPPGFVVSGDHPLIERGSLGTPFRDIMLVEEGKQL